jgi:glycolate oxidase FAD binding subunit
MSEGDMAKALREQVRQAIHNKTSLNIHGGQSKSFLGREPSGAALDIQPHRGIVNYEPTELVITARAGTPLRRLEEVLREHKQMLAFEPPAFGEHATLGGTIACNLSGPRRPYCGAARDHVLGCRIINGNGDILHFGGEVMKNVAGYDVSRLMSGAMGTLGVLLEVSLKVLPRPQVESTRLLELPLRQALQTLHERARLPLPISASCYDGARLYIRLSGTPESVRAAERLVGGEPLGEADNFWRQLREHRHAFFQSVRPLWRLSVPSDIADLGLSGKWLVEWGGAQRWLLSEAPADVIRRTATRFNGHATLYRNHGHQRDQAFHPLPAGLHAIHRRLKHAFDPHGLFNPGRLYQEL